MKIKHRGKLAQHEMVGFVLIVLIVTVIGIVFLSIMFGQNDAKKISSAEVSNLLSAAMYFTTDCSISYSPEYENIRDLISECYEDPQEDCQDGRKVCDILEPILEDLIDTSLDVSDDTPNRAYEFKIYHPGDDETSSEVIIQNTRGNFNNCSAIVGGNEQVNVRSSSKDIQIDLMVCKN